MIKIMYKFLFIAIFLQVSSPLFASENKGVENLAEIFFSTQRLPKIELSGEFSFYSLHNEVLRLDTKAIFQGVINMKNRHVNFLYSDYTRRIYNAKNGASEYKSSKMSCAFDGEKWLQVEYGQFPGNLESMAEITSGLNPRYFDTMDQFCFPLFGPLTKIQVGRKRSFLLDVISGKFADLIKISTSMVNKNLEVTFKAQCMTNVYVFDPSRNYVMLSKITEYGGCSKDAQKDKRKDVFTVEKFRQIGDVWIPIQGTEKRLLNGEVYVKRDFFLNDVKIGGDSKSIAAKIPANSFVQDDIHDIKFTTSNVDTIYKPSMVR